MLGFSSIMRLFLALKLGDNLIWYGTLCKKKKDSTVVFDVSFFVGNPVKPTDNIKKYLTC